MGIRLRATGTTQHANVFACRIDARYLHQFEIDVQIGDIAITSRRSTYGVIDARAETADTSNARERETYSVRSESRGQRGLC